MTVHHEVLHNESGWSFLVRKGPICSIAESDELSTRVGIPMPTMTFPHNLLKITHQANSFSMLFDTPSLLNSVSKQLPREIMLPNASHTFWVQKCQALGYPLEYDWTFWTENQGTVSSVHQFTKTDQHINYSRLASQKEEIRFFDSVDLYEDELSDNGRCLCDVRLRVMTFGYFVRLRCFLLVDKVVLQCKETRFFHEFDSNQVLRETRMYKESYTSCVQKLPNLHQLEVDQIVAEMVETERYTECMTI